MNGTFGGKGAKILLLDVEILPATGFFWDKPWETKIIQVIKQWRILSFSAKWLDGPQETYINHKTDKFIVKKLWKLLDKAEIVIAQNGDQFDIKKINSRFLFYNLPPPSPYRTVDTLKIARKHFGLLSNKLDDISQYTGLGRKIKTDKDLWLDCEKGDPKALKKMAKYNAQDVILLEKVYLKFLPWIKNHPNLGVYNENSCCPKCNSTDINFRGFYMNQTTKYRRFQCNTCQGWGRSPYNLQKNKVLVSI